MVAFKRQRYWICKKLHVNIYENKKVCTNWVRRILMTEVAYDIVKMFRAAKRAYIAAKFEGYVQWLIKRASYRRVVLNRFKSKIRKSLFVNLDNFEILDKRKVWYNFSKSKHENYIKMVRDPLSYSKSIKTGIKYKKIKNVYNEKKEKKKNKYDSLRLNKDIFISTQNIYINYMKFNYNK